MLRYALLIPDRESGQDRSSGASDRLDALPAPFQHHRFGDIMIACAGGPIVETAQGLVIGPFFDRRYPGPVTQLAQDDERRILASRGSDLIERFWGGYIAILHDADRQCTDIIRPPFGELPAYFCVRDGATVIASDLALLRQVSGLERQIDWGGIARELVWQDLRNEQTCVIGVRGLVGGSRLSVTRRGHELRRIWSPWNFIGRHGEESRAQLVERIGRDIRNCVQARATAHARIHILVSGGLDSSIIAACLAGRGEGVRLLTLFTRDAIGDERDHARAMANALGLALDAQLREVRGIDPMQSAAAALPRPATRLFEQETFRQASAAALSHGSDVIFTGGGGDTLFCSLQSGAPVADQLLSGKIGPGLLRTARDMSRLAQESVPAVLWSAFGRLFPWRRLLPLPAHPEYLSHHALERAGTKPPAHPWLEPKRSPLPGSAGYVKLLAALQSYYERYDPFVDVPTIHPLIAQPAVETCLGVPTWQWLHEGHNRALARMAFSPVLPEHIAWRRSKGTPESFVGEIFEARRDAFAAMLLDGRLAAAGLLDRPAVEAALRIPDRISSVGLVELMRLIDVEAWLRQQ